MDQKEITRKNLTGHWEKYPSLEIQDIFKYIYQSSLGCEHLVSSLDTVIGYLKKESENFSVCKYLTDELDGEYVRVHLSYLEKGLDLNTLAKLFFMSAKTESDGYKALEQKISVARELILEGKLPFSIDEFDKKVQKWQDDGYPALHHSHTFREKYKPAYRVVASEYGKFLPLFAKIDTALKNGNVILAIDGGSASGKSTLGEILKRIYDCTLFHTDDFFLQPYQRISARFAEVGGNLDRERFLHEVLLPLNRGEEVHYRKFDCSTFTLSEPKILRPTRLTVIEGRTVCTKSFRTFIICPFSWMFCQECNKIALKNAIPEKLHSDFLMNGSHLSRSILRKCRSGSAVRCAL